MDIQEPQPNCNPLKRKKPSTPNCCDDDRTAELEPTSDKSLDDDSPCGKESEDNNNNNNNDDDDNNNNNNDNKAQDFELMEKSDREIADSIVRIKRGLQTMSVRLPDGGKKFKANLLRHELELERRKKLQLEKAENGCDEAIQLSDHSDDGSCHGKKKSESKFANLFRRKMEGEQEDSRTVCAFEKDLTYINPCNGRKLKSQLSGKGRSRMGLSSSRSMKTSLVDDKKQMDSNDENKDGDSKSFSEPNSPHDPPSRNLRPRPLSYKEDSFLKFRKWWKGVSLFEKAYIFLPVHESAHWSLVIICLPSTEDELGPILLHLDSLGLHNSKSLFDNIKRYLKEEWSYLKKSKAAVDPSITDEICENLDYRVDHKRVTVPQQKNDYDCGLFVLLYMERFIKEAPSSRKPKRRNPPRLPRVRHSSSAMFGLVPGAV
ncbi:hypothetical protein M8C21_001899, partial [Ambrosia artemisiifolia]